MHAHAHTCPTGPQTTACTDLQVQLAALIALTNSVLANIWDRANLGESLPRPAARHYLTPALPHAHVT